MRGTFLVLKKELIEFSKDRKTLFFTLLFPLLIYPIVFTMMTSLARRDENQRKSKASRVALVDQSGALRPGLQSDTQNFTLIDPPSDLTKALADDQIDLQVEVAPDAASRMAGGHTFGVTVKSDDNSNNSKEAAKRFKTFLDATQNRLIEQRFESLGSSTEMAKPFEMKRLDVGDDLRAISRFLGYMLPYILMITMYAGAMQHGAYMSAGERERGTLMSLLATRLPRHDIILGKQLALFVLSIGTALINIIGVTFGMSRLAEASTTPAVANASQVAKLGGLIDAKVLLLTLLILIPLGLFFTAVVMLVGVQSKNTREASTALMPGIFIVIMLGVFSSAPGIEKMAFLPWVPVLNVSLAIRKLFAHQSVVSEYLLALSMTVALAATATALATRLLNRESALFKA